MSLHRVQLRDCPPQPWRNGGGLTRELLAWPRPGDWRVRVSVARIERDGPFSAFDGVQRCFAVLRGNGVALDWPTGAVRVTNADEAVSFDGAAAPGCRLLAGATDDLNLMARGGRPRLVRAHAGSVSTTARWRGLYAGAAVQLEAEGCRLSVEPDSLSWSDDDPRPWRLTLGSGWWLSLDE
jgi:environmental stress-induced protein Ves